MLTHAIACTTDSGETGDEQETSEAYFNYAEMPNELGALKLVHAVPITICLAINWYDWPLNANR